MWDSAAPTDAADLFGPDGITLTHGGRAFRRQLIAAILSRSTTWSGPGLLAEANEAIEALTGVYPGRAPKPVFKVDRAANGTCPDADTEFMMGI